VFYPNAKIQKNVASTLCWRDLLSLSTLPAARWGSSFAVLRPASDEWPRPLLLASPLPEVYVQLLLIWSLEGLMLFWLEATPPLQYFRLLWSE
jgi:hypothetical protein